MTRSHGEQRGSPAPPVGVDAICDVFEAAWLAGQEPRIEDFLPGGDPIQQDVLLQELLLAEWDLRWRHGRHSELQTYHGRFPESRHSITDLWRVWQEKQSESVLNGPANGFGTTQQGAPVEGIGTVIDRYKLLEKLGEGGFGTVWEAEQLEPVRRRVALKVIKLGMDSKQVVARFEAERQALALMDHPHIAKVLDAGTTGPASGCPGRPYFVMELVRGIPITKYCDQEGLATQDRLELFMKVCQAIQHAHQKGIIHRDIKPSNILVTLHDGVPVPMVIDFGIAKATQGVLTDKTIDTHFAQFIGTPAYMSPEQAEMNGVDIDTRSDIYSLGVLLYELLTGATPFDTDELIQSGLDEMRKIIREREPLTPSTRLTQLQQSAESKIVNHKLKIENDLDWIVMKCLEKDRSRRYETANGLAQDLHRHLNDEPVVARPPSVAYRFQKAWRRNKLIYSATAIVVATLLIGMAASGWQAARATQAKQDAESARADEAKQRIAAQQAHRTANLQRGRAEQNAEELIRHLYVADIKVAHQALQEENLSLARQLIYKYLPAIGVPTATGTRLDLSGQPSDKQKTLDIKRDLLGWEWRYLWQLCQGEESFTFGQGHDVRSIAFSPDGGLVAMAKDQTVEIVDLKSRRAIARLDGFDGFISNGGLAFSHQGRYLAAKGGTVVRIWEVGKWDSPLAQFQGPRTYVYTFNNEVEFSPDDATFTTRVPGGLRCWDTSTWRENHFEAAGEHFGAVLNYTRDGKWLAISDWHKLEIRDAKSLQQIEIFEHQSDHREWQELRVMSMDSSAELMAAGYRDGEVILWEIQNWREVGRFQAHPSYVLGLTFSPDGQTLVTGGSDPMIKIWDVALLTADLTRAEPPTPIRTLRGHELTVYTLDFSPDGQSLASTSKDGTAKFWNSIEAGGPAGLANSKAPLWFAPDGGRLITLNYDGRLHLWETRSRRDLGPLGPQIDANSFTPKTISEDGKWLALGRRDGVIELWNLQTNEREKSWKEDDFAVPHLAFSRRGNLLAASSDRKATNEHGSVRIWDTVSGRMEREFANAFGPLTFSANDRRLASTRFDGSVVIWDLGTGRSVVEIPEDITMAGSVAFSPVDDRLATGSEDPVVHLWDLASREELYSLQGSRMCIDEVAFTVDGRTLAARTVDNAIKLWNVATGKELLNIGYLMEASSFLFSPNGEYLALATDVGRSGEWRVELWRAPSFEVIAAAEASRQKEINTQ